jgi:DNA invertase Pin-like site-specific DNA recombinase
MQSSYYTEFIKRNPNWKLVGIFTDKASAKSIKKRTGFQKMLSLCRKGEIDCILVKSIKRFSRNTVDTLRICEELKSLNIDILFELEHLHLSQLNSMLALTIYASFAQNEIENLSADTRLGIQHSFSSGNSKYNSRPCYGYRRVNDSLVIHEEEANIIRKIFALRLAGWSFSRIKNTLEDYNIPSPKGRKTWNTGVIYYILHNEKYVGSVMLGKTFVKDLFTGRQVKNIGQRDKYLIEENHPPIISKDDFEKV